MSAERGWIGEPQPEKEWHTPGWLREKGTATATSSVIGRVELPSRSLAPGLEVSRDSVGDSDAMDGGK
jgi:hypothetical protein